MSENRDAERLLNMEELSQIAIEKMERRGMGSEFRTMSLREAGVELIDCDHRTPPAAAFGYPYIAIPQLKDGRIELGEVRRISKADFDDWTRKLKPIEHDVIVVRRCSSGDSAVVHKGLECAIGQNLVVLRANGNKVLPGFLRWLVRSAEWWEQVHKFMNVGAVFNSLKCKEIPNFQVLIPPLEDQKEITEILTGLDDHIVLLRESNATLEAIAQAIFRSWFVDFDPVRAKAEGRDPEGVPPEAAHLFPDSFEDSELGPIPKGWQVTRFGDLCALTKGCSYKGSGLSDNSGAYMFNLGCFNAKRVFARQNIKRYTGEYKPRHEVLPGDLIVANTDMTQARDILGRPLLVPIGFSPGFVSHHVYRVAMYGRFNSSAAKSYVYFSLLQVAFRERAIGFATGTTVLAMPKEAVEEYRTPFPPTGLLEAFGELIQPMLALIEQNELQAESLSSLRDALLPRLMSGKLRIPVIEEALA